MNKSIQQAEKEGNSKKSALSKQAEELAKIKQILDDKTEQVLDYEEEIKRLNVSCTSNFIDFINANYTLKILAFFVKLKLYFS